MKDLQTSDPTEKATLAELPVTPRTVHKSDPEETPDPEEDEDHTQTGNACDCTGVVGGDVFSTNGPTAALL